MYVPPFAAGVLTTLFVIFGAILVAAYISWKKDKNK